MKLFHSTPNVGQRTIEKGFVAADALSTTEGLFPAVGGGISQFTNALFNAAFFAGLDIPESQAHSYHFERYPYGREATINWNPPIDLKITNNTEADILIWIKYMPDSTTISLYGVPYLLAVKELAQTREKINNCTNVTITRSRTYPDGSIVIDEFYATYQDELKKPCIS